MVAGDPPSPHDGSVVEIKTEAGVGLAFHTSHTTSCSISGHDDGEQVTMVMLEVQGDESADDGEERSNDNGLVQAVEASGGTQSRRATMTGQYWRWDEGVK